ncbi:MAG: 50S ribosomal protein L19 [Parcubacteria group bacterium]|nr:50S ribosomal protein L19 [Parcubacteria group bacterium]
MESRQKLGIRAGDTVRVWQKIQEKGKTRLQAFEGLVLAHKHGNEAGATFTVRKVASGVGVEKIFPLYSPIIDKIEIIKRSKVRRAKLYHIREKAAKEIKRQMRHATMVDLQTVSDTEEATKKVADEEAAKKAVEEAEAKAQEEAKKAEEVVEEVKEEKKEEITETVEEKTEEAKIEAPKKEEK